MAFKDSLTFPLYKKGDVDNKQNYGGISINLIEVDDGGR